MSDLPLSFSRRDPQDVDADLRQRLTKYSNEEWTDFSDNDISFALAKTYVELSDFNAAWVDYQLGEAFLSICRQRESAVRLAKMLNYPIGKAGPASLSVTVTFPAFNALVTIPANTVWLVNEIPFINESNISIQSGQTSFTATFTQGTRYTDTKEADGTSYYKIKIPNNVTDIEVRVEGELWTEVDSFINLPDPDIRTYYKTYEDVGGVRVITFEAGHVADKPTSGDSIEVLGIATMGTRGNIYQTGLSVSPVSIIRDGNNNDITNFFVGVTNSLALDGTDVETIESIKRNAPLYYQTQGRAVTDVDYEAYVRTVPGVKDVQVIGGEKIGRYGDILVIVTPDDPEIDEADFLALIKQKILDKRMILISESAIYLSLPDLVDQYLSVEIGAYDTQYQSLSVAQEAVMLAINNFYDTRTTGVSVYESDLLPEIKKVSGLKYAKYTFTIKSYGKSQAGKLSIPLVENYDISNCVIRKADNTVLFSGNGTSYVKDGAFQNNYPGMVDQKCTLEYVTTSDDLVVRYNQTVQLKGLTITPRLVS